MILMDTHGPRLRQGQLFFIPQKSEFRGGLENKRHGTYAPLSMTTVASNFRYQPHIGSVSLSSINCPTIQ